MKLSTLLTALTIAFAGVPSCDGCRRRLLEGVDETKDMHSRVVTETTKRNDDTSTTSNNGSGVVYTTEIVLEQQSELDFGWMKDHVDEMQARMHNGDIARAWDPLFQAYFQAFAKGEFETSCQDEGDGTMVCTKTALTECARDLIRGHGAYHMKIRDSLKESGNDLIEDDHAVPETCK